MRTAQRPTRRLRGLAGIAAFAAAALVVTAVPALATPAPGSPASFGVWHPQDDYAGVQIAAHEGTKGPMSTQDVSGPLGLDVSGHQGTVDWPTAAGNHAVFAYVKATEGTYYINPDFAQQYNGSYQAGLIRGAYHFATPNTTGRRQPGRLLPGARRRLVQGRQNAPARHRSGVQPLRGHVLRPDARGAGRMGRTRSSTR